VTLFEPTVFSEWVSVEKKKKKKKSSSRVVEYHRNAQFCTCLPRVIFSIMSKKLVKIGHFHGDLK